jgi:hypothetical protein
MIGLVLETRLGQGFQSSVKSAYNCLAVAQPPFSDAAAADREVGGFGDRIDEPAQRDSGLCFVPDDKLGTVTAGADG